jgi:hypothetical protein
VFIPPRCPWVRCEAHLRPFDGFFVRQGCYRPLGRAHAVPRFRCRVCRRGFSRQSFRADYRHKKAYLNATCLRLFISCVGQRQAARVLQVARRTIERRFRWLAEHADGFHRNRLRGAELAGPFQLDEMESFEANRYQPVTVPVLIDRRTFFIVATATGPLRRKGRMTAHQKRRRTEHEKAHGRRPSHSSRVVREVLMNLAGVVGPRRPFVIESDQKPDYGRIGRRLFRERLVWSRHPASARRDRSNPLFPINHTNARLRHFLSRLRRRTWCISKKREDLRRHLAIAALWVNYSRGITNRTAVTPAQALGLLRRPLRPEELLSWRQDWGARSPEIA